METGERGQNRVSALAEELFAANKKDSVDCDISGNSKSVEASAKKKSSFGKLRDQSLLQVLLNAIC